MTLSIKVKKVKAYVGHKYGVATKTAEVLLTINQPLSMTNKMSALLAQKVKEITPVDYSFVDSRVAWPDNFLIYPSKKHLISHWLIGLCTAMQHWARIPVYKGLVLTDSETNIVLALSYQNKNLLIEALEFTAQFISSWINHSDDENTKKQFESWLEAAQRKGLSPNGLYFSYAVFNRNIPLSCDGNVLGLGQANKKIKLLSSFSSNTNIVATQIARNKFSSKKLLASAGLPVPNAKLITTAVEFKYQIKSIALPLVVKPQSQDGGTDVYVNLNDLDRVEEITARMLKKYDDGVIVEHHHSGHEYRMLVFGGKLRMVAHRIPASVIGDGKRSIKQLVDLANEDVRRGDGQRSLLKKLVLDDASCAVLASQNVDENSVPDIDQIINLSYVSNISRGGTAIDVTDNVHPDNRFLAERAASSIGLDIAGIDFISPDISKSWREVGGVIIEVNAQPGFRVHWICDTERDINGEVIDWLFPDSDARIPTTAITGTNGKTTTASMLHHIWLTSGKNSGLVTTAGVWIGKHQISSNNLSGCPGGQVILQDPMVEAAVIEMPRKGLILFGHPCDSYSVSALLNIEDDHIGVNGVNSLEDMANLKGAVLRQTTGTIVVNAEDQLCLQAGNMSPAQNRILVSRDGDLDVLKKHIAAGGMAVYLTDIDSIPWIALTDKRQERALMSTRDIPATMNGVIRCNEFNALFATALAWANNIPIENIIKGLTSFSNSVELNPGRFNLISGFPFTLMVDFAHNPQGVKQLVEVIKEIPVTGKRRLLMSKVGNRHRHHIRQTALMLAESFDSVIVSADKNYVLANEDWKGSDPMGLMLSTVKEQLIAAGLDDAEVTVEKDRTIAVTKALNNAKTGDLLVILENYSEVLPIIHNQLTKF